jgi:hypothetical protein
MDTGKREERGREDGVEDMRRWVVSIGKVEMFCCLGDERRGFGVCIGRRKRLIENVMISCGNDGDHHDTLKDSG